ncbi:hypothetical protein LOTGIDRAFT_229541 [Lottia gigantea]|uniref:Chitin-binding type-2 domain-containing protein n=1 Tax=Lottia gigantea TaxID=225164 RepID=V3ZNE6_LOTGI|nr:hypothetical protein LOTGIDRAFT_229541 [Lottia gigantea]ESO83985.1 hypothetical protein LOTGIDRAFT_229541 [Lottia gigantea]
MLSLRLLVVVAALLVLLLVVDSSPNGPRRPDRRRFPFKYHDRICDDYHLPDHAYWVITEDCDKYNRPFRCDDSHYLQVTTECHYGKWKLSYECIATGNNTGGSSQRGSG